MSMVAPERELAENDILEYLKRHENKSLLRFLTCGSVDDGKSTLIGRLLHDAKMIYEDQLSAVKSETTRYGTTGEEVDLALLVDGLTAEKEQGITIDVAYRYFSTDKKKFIIADTPGHEQYTRNMATGASNCEVAVILVDARNGIQVQTRRHSYIVSLLGIRHVILAVNKMDLVDYEQSTYDSICSEYKAFAAELGIAEIQTIPVSALKGDNVVDPSESLSWFAGPTLLEALERIDPAQDQDLVNFRLPVQYVNRPNLDFRGYCGTIVSGAVQPGDRVQVLPSGETSLVKSIVTYDGELDQAGAGEAVTLTLVDEIDVTRGDVIVAGEHPFVGKSFRSKLVWMNDAPLVTGKEYLFRFGNHEVPGRVSRIVCQTDVNTLSTAEASELKLNETGDVEIQLTREVVADAYGHLPQTGCFIMIDRLSNATLSAGMVVSQVELKEELVSTESAYQTAYGHKAGVISLYGSMAEALASKLSARFMQLRGRFIYLREGSASEEVIQSLVSQGVLVALVGAEALPESVEVLAAFEAQSDNQSAVEDALEALIK